MDSQLFLLLVGKHAQIDRYLIAGDVFQETTAGTIESVSFDGAPGSDQVSIAFNTGSVTITSSTEYVRVKVFD